MSAQAKAAAFAGMAGFITEFIAVRELYVPSARIMGDGAILVVAAAGLIVAPLLSGIAGGLVSRRARTLAGSVGGFLTGALGALLSVAALDGRPLPALTASIIAPAAFFVVPVAMGHLTAVAIRPRVAPA